MEIGSNLLQTAHRHNRSHCPTISRFHVNHCLRCHPSNRTEIHISISSLNTNCYPSFRKKTKFDGSVIAGRYPFNSDKKSVKMYCTRRRKLLVILSVLAATLASSKHIHFCAQHSCSFVAVL